MSDVKLKWLFYTLIIALVPFFIRIVLSQSLNLPTEKISVSDLVAFSLVMQVSTIGGAESLSQERHRFKTICFSISIILVLFSGIYYALSLIAEKNPSIMNLNSCIYVLIVICLTSTILSYATHDRLHKDTIMRGGI